MEDKILLTSVIYYSLFHKKIFNNEDENNIIKKMPKNTFGVFTTIRRSHILHTWPIDIHGCIGYWNSNFNKLNQTDLYYNLLRVSYDALWNDNRKQYFDSIDNDINSYLEIDFMLQPIYNIDKNTGKIIELNKSFDNKKFGIIIQNFDKTSKATYLPNVFPNMSWKKMITSIKNKANINNDEYNVFAYKIKQIKTKIISILTDKIFISLHLLQFSKLLVSTMKFDLPYPFFYSCKNNILEWNTNDNVRNISTLGGIIKYINLYPSIIKKNQFDFIKQKIFTILHDYENYTSQTLSFLGFIFTLYDNTPTNNKNNFCNKLLHDLPSAESEFEKPEIIIGLSNAGCNIDNKKYILTFNTNDSIFKMNWTIQALISLDKQISSELITIFESKINSIIINKNNIETNYLAVAFEALCFLYSSTNKIHLLDKIFQLFLEIEKRKNCHNTLYSFLDNSSRVDITEHINNGFFQLLHIHI